MKKILKFALLFALLNFLSMEIYSIKANTAGSTRGARPSGKGLTVSLIGNCPISGRADIFTIVDDDIKSPLDFHLQLAAVMKFPSYYGNNLDALEEVLNDYFTDKTSILFWNNFGSGKGLAVDYREKVIKVFADFSEQNNDHFCLILR